MGELTDQGQGQGRVTQEGSRSPFIIVLSKREDLPSLSRCGHPREYEYALYLATLRYLLVLLSPGASGCVVTRHTPGDSLPAKHPCRSCPLSLFRFSFWMGWIGPLGLWTMASKSSLSFRPCQSCLKLSFVVQEKPPPRPSHSRNRSRLEPQDDPSNPGIGAMGLGGYPRDGWRLGERRCNWLLRMTTPTFVSRSRGAP